VLRIFIFNCLSLAAAAARVQPGAARAITAADLSSLFQPRPGQAGGAGRPQQAAQPVTRRSQSDGASAAPSGGARQATVPQQLLRELVEMGFEERKARAALLRNNNEIEIAVDWLSENWDKPDSFYDDVNPVPSAPAMTAAVAGAPSRPHFEPSPEVKRYADIFDPVLRAVALVANGDSRTNRAALEGVRLPAMEKDGWRNLTSVVRRIWAGERDDAALTAHLDANTSFLVGRILEFIRSGNVVSGEIDFYVRHAIPKDPQVEATTLAPLRPWVQRIARMAKRQTSQTFGDVDAPPSAEDQQEDESIARFVLQLDSRGWQLRGPLEMLCAGVRSDSDVLECIAALPNGLPDDNSARLVHAIMEELERLG
jgi:hypothetical protein